MFFPSDQPLSRQLPNLNACNMLQTTEVFIIHRAWVPSLCTDIMAVYKKNHKGQLNTDTVGGKLVKQDKKKKCLFLKWHLLFSGQIPTQSSSFNLHTFYWMCRPIYTGKDQRIPWTVTLTKCFSPENIHVSETSDTMLNTFTSTKALARSMGKEQADTCFQLMQSVAYW